LHVANGLQRQGNDDVLLVELAALTEASQVAVTIAASIGAQQVPNRSPLETLVGYLRHATLLLVLDNCEHLIDEAAFVVERLLQGCPQLRILATSREPLHVAGERAYRLPSLETAAAAALFVDRAGAADHTFIASDENAMLIAEICRRLDGIPLAIELAAVRVAILPLAVLAEKLDRRFALLTGGVRTALPRQRTMRATIEWSVALLGDAERALMRRLQAFSGGWTLEAAEAVCANGTLEPPDILECLGSLVDKSLVTVRFSGEFRAVELDGSVNAPRQPRYGFLQSIRAYVLEELPEQDGRETLLRRHAGWAADYGEWLNEWTFYDPDGFHRTAMLPDAFEIANRYKALKWALAADEVMLAGRIAGTSGWFDTPTAMLPLIESALAGIAGTGCATIEARLRLSLAEQGTGQHVLDSAQRAVSLFERIGELNHWYAASVSLLTRRLHAMGRYEESLANSDVERSILSELDAFHGVRRNEWSQFRGQILTNLGRYDEARVCINEALASTRFRLHWLAYMTSLSVLEAYAGNLQRGLELTDEAAALIPSNERLGLEGAERAQLVTNRNNAVAWRLALGDIQGAREAALESIDLAQRRWGGVAVLTHLSLATVDALLGNAHGAARLKGYIDAWYAENADVLEPLDRRTYDIMTETLNQRFSVAEIAQRAAEGAALDADQAAKVAIEIARALRASS
jgi:predicted ATPase